MLLRLKLGPRMAILILFGTGAVLAAVVASDYTAARRLLEDDLKVKAQLLASSTARAVAMHTRSVEKVIDEAALALALVPVDVARSYELLEATVQRHPELFGAAVAIARPADSGNSAGGESASRWGSVANVPYIYRDAGKLVRKDLAGEAASTDSTEWYEQPRRLLAPIWTEPYFDDLRGGVVMVTYAVPILVGPGRKFAGVVAGDLALDWLESILAHMQLGEGGKAFVLSKLGTFIAHWRQEWILGETIFSLGSKLGSTEATRVGESMLKGESGFVEYTGFQEVEPRWLAYAPIPGIGWSMGAVFSRRQIATKLLELGRGALVLAILGALGMTAVALLIARSVSRPIRELDAAACVLASGDLEAMLPTSRGKDETARLTQSFSAMRNDLRRRISELKETTAARAKIENELETARSIQLDLLPSRFHFDPPHPEVDIFAILEPARAVGGDFYDFFLTGPDRLFFAVADVSGKGVSAAIFMAVSKAYLKAFVREKGELSSALSKLNDELVVENDEAMFLTAFCAEMDLRSGECRYVNGGHEPPLILRGSGIIEELPKLKGPLIGLAEGVQFEVGAFRLEPGALLLASSDGVADAEEIDGAFYGEERTKGLLGSLGGRSAQAVVEEVHQDIKGFTRRAPPSDDITLLAIRYAG